MEPRNACDRNLATRWSSDFSDPQWILFKFPKPVTISELRLWWETAYAKEYEIQISLDQQNWTSVFHEKKGDGELDKIEFEPISTQHLRILCLRRGTAYGYSIFEVEILG